MKRQPKRTKRRVQQQLWTYARAQAACPFIRSVVASLREHFLALQSASRRLEVLERQPGRPDRQALIKQHEVRQEKQKAQEQLDDASTELDALNIFVLDPIQGQVLLPFVYNDQLAWYIFDLFDSKPLRFWRFQDDSLDTRRPIASLQQGIGETTSKT
jgi:hypothetical protein